MDSATCASCTCLSRKADNGMMKDSDIQDARNAKPAWEEMNKKLRVYFPFLIHASCTIRRACSGCTAKTFHIAGMAIVHLEFQTLDSILGNAGFVQVLVWPSGDVLYLQPGDRIQDLLVLVWPSGDVLHRQPGDHIEEHLE